MSFTRAAVRRFNDPPGVHPTATARRVHNKRQNKSSLSAHHTASGAVVASGHGVDGDSSSHSVGDGRGLLPAPPPGAVQSAATPTLPLSCPLEKIDTAPSAISVEMPNIESTASADLDCLLSKPQNASGDEVIPTACRTHSSELNTSLSSRCPQTVVADELANAMQSPPPSSSSNSSSSCGIGDGGVGCSVDTASGRSVELANATIRATSRQAKAFGFDGEAENCDEEASESAALMFALKAEVAASRATIAALRQQLADARAAHAEVQGALDGTEDDCKKLQRLLDESRLECADKAAACQAQLKRLRCLEKIVRSNSRDASSPGAEHDAADHRETLHEYCCTLQAENDRLQQELHAGCQSERQSREMIRQLQGKVTKASTMQLELEEKQRYLLQENVALTIKAADLAKERESLEKTVESLVEQRDAARTECETRAVKIREIERTLEELRSSAADDLRRREDAQLAESLRAECDSLRRQLRVGADELAAARSSLAASEAVAVAMQSAMASLDARAKQELEAAHEAAALAKADASAAAAMELRGRSEALANAQMELSRLQARCSSLADNNESLLRKCAVLEARSSEWDAARAQLQHAESLRLLLISDLESARAAASLATSRADAAEQELLRARLLAQETEEEARRAQERLVKSKSQVEELLAVNRQLSEKLVAQSTLHRQIEEHRTLLDRARAEAGVQVEAAAAEKRALCSLIDGVRSECRAACDKAQLSARAESERLRLQMDEYCRRIVGLQTKLCAANAEIQRLRTEGERDRTAEQMREQQAEEEKLEHEEKEVDEEEQQQQVPDHRAQEKKTAEPVSSTSIPDHVAAALTVKAVHYKVSEGQPIDPTISRRSDSEYDTERKISTDLQPPVAVNQPARSPFDAPPLEMSRRSSPSRFAPRAALLLTSQGKAFSSATPLGTLDRPLSTQTTGQQQAHTHRRYAKQTGHVTHAGSSPFRDVTNIRT